MASDPDAVIRSVLHIKRGDSLPFTSWSKALVTRQALAEIFAGCGYTRGAEIGVRIGSFSEHLLQNVPGLHMTCVDMWAAYDNHSAENQERAYQQACRRLRQYPTTIIRKPSTEAAKDVADGSLDFAYIDAAHDFDHVAMDLITWAPKVRKGGIVSGHDFFCFYQSGVVQAHIVTNGPTIN